MTALVVGVLIMTSILAGAPMYLKSIEALGLQSALQVLSPSNRNVQVSVDRLPLTKRSVVSATEQVDVALRELGNLPISVTQESHTRLHYWGLKSDAIIPGPASDSAILQRFEGFSTHVDYVEGGAPSELVTQEAAITVAQVAVPVDRAELLGVTVGDDIWIASSTEDPPYLKLQVVGLFTPRDLQEEFWFGLGREVMDPPSPSLVARPPLPLFLSKDVLFDVVTGGSAAIGAHRWLVQLDFEELQTQSPSNIAGKVDLLEHALRRGLPESTVISALGNPLRSLVRRISFARIPTLMMGGVLLLAAGYYSIMAAAGMVSRRRVDTARLWGRGTGRRQMANLFFKESMFLVLIPAGVAPFVAGATITGIGWLPSYESVLLGSGMPVYLSWHPFAWSFAGAGAVIAYMQWSVWNGGGRSIPAEKMSIFRVDGKPFLQRYYLDFFFFVFGGLVLWDLSSETSVVTDGGSEVAGVNPLLVVGPAIFLAVAVIISLRVLPPLARLISSGFARRAPVWVHLISSLFARVPLTYAWPVAILGMAAGTVMFSATIAATLEQSSVDQSGYEVGTDLRIFPVDLSQGPLTGVLNSVRSVEGVRGVSSGLRTVGAIRLGGEGVPFEFLAIEPQYFEDIGVFRNDYSSVPIQNLINDLEYSIPLAPLFVSESAKRVGFRMRSDVIATDIRASMRLRDAEGFSHSVDLGPVTSREWQVRMGKLPSTAILPVEVLGLTFFELTPNEIGTPVVIHIDDLMFDLDDGPPVVFESFDDEKEMGNKTWYPLASVAGVDTSSTIFHYSPGTGETVLSEAGLQISLGIGTDRGVRGVVRASSGTVPVLISQTALESNDLVAGSETVINVFNRSVPVRVVNAVEYFPTLEPGDGGFVVADIQQLWKHLALSSANSAGVSAEIFVGLVDSNDTNLIDSVSSEIGGLHSVSSREEIRRMSVVTPLAVAGWQGASIVTGLIATLLALMGFLTFGSMRPAVDEFNLAVLKALGMSKPSFILITFLEQLLVLVFGVVAGVTCGFFMARIAVHAASQTDIKANTLPPVVFSTDWIYVGGFVLTLVLLSSVIFIVDVFFLKRIRVVETIRISGQSG